MIDAETDTNILIQTKDYIIIHSDSFGNEISTASMYIF